MKNLVKILKHKNKKANISERIDENSCENATHCFRVGKGSSEKMMMLLMMMMTMVVMIPGAPE